MTVGGLDGSKDVALRERRGAGDEHQRRAQENGSESAEWHLQTSAAETPSASVESGTWKV